ncbi:unnamed protein product [Diamesa hyperborea]
MTEFLKTLDKNCKSQNILLRPDASNGLWLSSLLFFAYLRTILRNPETIQLDYEITTVITFGLFLQTLEISLFLSFDGFNKLEKFLGKLVPGAMSFMLLTIILEQNLIFSIITGFFIPLIYNVIYVYILKVMPRSFTLGEGSIVVQAFVIFLYNCFLKLPFLDDFFKSEFADVTVILQVGLLGAMTIVTLVHFFRFLRHWIIFFAMLIFVLFVLCCFPIRSHPALIILIDFVFGDAERSIVTGLYVILLVLAATTVIWQIRKNRKSSTSIRKVFHVLIVMVYLPGLLYQCTFLYVASGVILAILIILETARIIKLYPVSDILETSVLAFIDEKDAGFVALTPLYLLVGCSLPMWIHNFPSDWTGTAGFEILPMISGILSIGIGDTLASVVGSKIGKHKWHNSSKSVEGTLASIIGQSAFVYTLFALGCIPMTMKLAAICEVAILSNALIEARTNQVDNLVLPLVTYIILTFK